MTEKKLANIVATTMTIITGVTLLSEDEFTLTHALMIAFNTIAVYCAINIEDE